MEPEWTTEWPTETGRYWFYGYRYGKVSVGREQRPYLMLMNATRLGDGSFMYIGDGQFVYEKDAEQAHFCKFVSPELPELEN